MNRNKRSLCIDLKLPGGARRASTASSPRATSCSTTTARAACAASASTTSRSPPSTRTSSPCRSRATAPPGPTRRGCRGDRCSRRSPAWPRTTGHPDGGPLKMGAALPDPMGGTHCAFAILAALSERDRTGQGMYLDISQLETYASIGGEIYLAASLTGEAPPRRGNRSLGYAPQGVYPCAGDDAWIAITVGVRRGVGGARVGRSATTRCAIPSSTSVVARFERHDEHRRGDRRVDVRSGQARADPRAAGRRRHRLRVDDQPRHRRGPAPDGAGLHGGVGPAGRRARRYPGFPIHFSKMAPPPMRPCPASARTTTTCWPTCSVSRTRPSPPSSATASSPRRRPSEPNRDRSLPVAQRYLCGAIP